MVLPVDAWTVAPGFPQAGRGIRLVSAEAVGQQRVDAVKGVGSIQWPPAPVWVMLVVLALHAGGGVTGGLLHAAAALLSAVEGQQPEVDLVQLPLAVVERLSRIVRLAQPVDVKRRAARRGALGLRVQGGRGRRQRALPPNTSSVAPAV